MNYSIDDLRAFCAVVRLGRFSEAADATHITASALSRRIANIERQIGGPLFVRSTRKVTLTPMGAELHDKVLPLISQLDSTLLEAARSFSSGSRTLAIATVATVAYSSLHRISQALLEVHPEVLLAIRDGTAALVTNLVEQGAVEFGITTQLIFGPSIQTESLGHYGFNLILAPGHEVSKLRSRKSVDWKELGDLKLVGLNPLSSTRLQIDGALASLGLQMPWSVEVDQLSTLLSMVSNAGYASVLPTLFDYEASGFLGIPIKRPSLARELFLIKRPDSHVSDAGAVFAQHAKTLIHGVRR